MTATEERELQERVSRLHVVLLGENGFKGIVAQLTEFFDEWREYVEHGRFANCPFLLQEKGRKKKTEWGWERIAILAACIGVITDITLRLFGI